jgi:hypothetical protein
LRLVKEDADITGLVAYSIYKQNKLDWIRAFEKHRGRRPNEAEVFAYTIGEGTPRRLVTYRHLADALLSGNILDSSCTQGDRHKAISPRNRLKGWNAEPIRGLAWVASSLIIYAAIVVTIIIGLWLAVRTGIAVRF